MQTGVYLVNLTMGNQLPGAPTAALKLVINLAQQAASGSAVISLVSSDGTINHITVLVTGTIKTTGFGQYSQLVSLYGQYTQSVPPPANGSFMAKFVANFAIDKTWNGTGVFAFNNQQVQNAHVTPV